MQFCTIVRDAFPKTVFLCLLIIFLVAGCGRNRAFVAETPVLTSATAGDALQGDDQKGARIPGKDSASMAPVWSQLAQRMASDGVAGPRVDALFAALPSTPTQSPMGRKMRELYMRRFYPKPPSGKGRQRYYKNVVTPKNAQICREFVAANQQAFAFAERRYAVPANIAVALLFVETRLGKVLGDVPENAFFTLASMAVSRKPEDIADWLPKMPGYEKHLDWFEETMPKRADWAYKETLALVKHMLHEGVTPQSLPGSIYGAIGMCQFMPSNISVYGADGSGDGRVDLFDTADAVASLANYLARHGWKAGITRATQHKLLMTYNHSQVYANTILGLSDLVAARPEGARKGKAGARKAGAR